ncbi:hypothetical protein F4677DRAFT_56621 [Hypoxylon crocopeplum]|nr:hypothetical protein F4677DRAFT_56621 [Hypoxylon crocopeplum]
MSDATDGKDPETSRQAISDSEQVSDHDQPELPIPSLAKDSLKCSICLNDVPSSSLTTLPCNHSFHAKCIRRCTQVYKAEQYHEGRVKCPMCRRPLLYQCEDVISAHHLLPGVKILPQELAGGCPDCQASLDDDEDSYSIPYQNRPLNPRRLRWQAHMEHLFGMAIEMDEARLAQQRWWNQAEDGQPGQQGNVAQEHGLGQDPGPEQVPEGQHASPDPGGGDEEEEEEVEVTLVVKRKRRRDIARPKPVPRPAHHNFLFITQCLEPEPEPDPKAFKK